MPILDDMCIMIPNTAEQPRMPSIGGGIGTQMKANASSSKYFQHHHLSIYLLLKMAVINSKRDYLAAPWAIKQ